jgi:hypothetical protein
MAPSGTQDGAVAIDGYDRLDLHRLVPQLRLRSQAELASIDAYERAHQDRKPVLDKLRYLRNDEPFDGYDGMSADEVVAALRGADLRTLDATRDYEMKLQRRPEVLEPAAQLRREAARDPGAGPEEAAVVWQSDDRGGILGGFTTLAVLGMMTIAVVLMVVALVILVFLVIDAVAPNTFIG